MLAIMSDKFVAIIGDVLKTGIGAFFGTLFGFEIARHFQRDEKLADERAMVLRRIEMIRESLAQAVVQIEHMEIQARAGLSTGLRIVFPDDYYKDLPFEVIFKHLGRETLDNVKNITRVALPRWNQMAAGPNRNDNEVVSNLCVLARQETIPRCRQVIQQLEQGIPEIGRTSVPGFVYE